MKNKKIKKKFKVFKEARKSENYENLVNIARELDIPVPSEFVAERGIIADCGKIISEIYTRLQTEIMINTIRDAKWSCFWAAVAAISSLIAVALGVWSMYK